MMKIYSISIKNEELKELVPQILYFQEQRTAEAVMDTFDRITNIKLEWGCEAISPRTHQEALDEFVEASDIVCKE